MITSIPVSNRLLSQIISTEITKLNDATLITFIKEDIFFKNNFVIGLLGAFVLFFCIFVLTYVYFKCCRKRTIDNKISDSEWKAHYQSLSRGVTEPEHTVQPANLQINDSVYLSPSYHSPVLNRYENIEIINLHANDEKRVIYGVVETTMNGEIRATDQMYTNEPNISLADQSENVYHEIHVYT